MRIILGLGNPGQAYQKTRHNIGKMLIDMLVTDLNATEVKKSPKYTAYRYKDTILANSEVYMNLSAQAVQGLIKTYPQAKIEHFITSTRIRKTEENRQRRVRYGPFRGHRGILSIMNKFKTKDVNRLQLGIGRPQSRDPEVISNYVLSVMPKQETQLLKESYDKAFSLLKSQGFL